MEVLSLTIFVSVMFAIAAGAAFTWSVRSRAHDHGQRLALLPLSEDTPTNLATAPGQPGHSADPTGSANITSPTRQEAPDGDA